MMKLKDSQDVAFVLVSYLPVGSHWRNENQANTACLARVEQPALTRILLCPRTADFG